MEERVFEIADASPEKAAVNAGREALRRALDADLRDSLPQMALIFGLFFLVLTISHITLLAGLLGLVMAITVLVLLLVTAGAEFFVVSFVAPAYPMAELLPTPTLDLMATPTATLAPGAAAPLIVPTIAENISSGCVPGVIDWTSPAEGEQVNGMVELTGSVNVPNLGFYKYEFSSPGQDDWQTIAAGNTTKVNEPLGGVWNTEQLVPGDYLLRLVVTDNENNAMTPCIIPVQVVAVE